MLKRFSISNVELLSIIFVFVFSFVFFFKDTFLFWQCLFAALITTALFAATYAILKWFFLALK